MDKQCVCSSGRRFSVCCEPFLKQQAIATTPEQLMRSRYSAYALGGYGGYLLNTWFPPMARDLKEENLSESNTQWLKLEILQSDCEGSKGWVEFKALYKERETVAEMHEKSVFIKIAECWFYIGGEVRYIRDSGVAS